MMRWLRSSREVDWDWEMDDVSRWGSSRVIKDDHVEPVLLESVSRALQPCYYDLEGGSWDTE
jgi:hypothetical protein